MTKKELDRLESLKRELQGARLLALDAAYDRYTCEPNSDEAVKACEAVETALKHLNEIINPKRKIRICRRCGAQVQRSKVDGYAYSCPECDEDLYEFETMLVNHNKEKP